MANRHWVGGTDTWNATAGTKWATTSGGAGGAAVPTAADDVFFDGASGVVTCTVPVGGTVVCRSIDCTGFTGSLVTSSSCTLVIGTSTAGAGNIALKLVAGMTYTGAGTIQLVSTSATTQTITTAGKTMQAITVQGAGANYQFADALISSGNLIYTAAASLDLNSFTHTVSTFTITGNANVRNLIFGTAIVNCNLFGGAPFTAAGATNVTITASVGAQINATNSNNPGINLGSTTFTNVAFAHTSTAQQNVSITSSGATIYSYTRTGAAVSKVEQLLINGTLNIDNSFNVNGNARENRMIVLSSVAGTQAHIVNNGSYSLSNVDFQDIDFSGSASTNFSAITGLSGDCGGNSGATFTTPMDVYWVPASGTSTGSWSATARWASSSGGTAGTGRTPLPQDNVFIDGNSIDAGSRTITLDMPRVGKNVSFLGATNTPTLSWATSVGQAFYGSVTFINAMTMAFANTVNWTLAGRGSYTFDSGGKTFTGTNMSTIINCGTGDYTLASAYTTGHAISHTSGGFDTAGYTVTSGSYANSGSIARSLSLGASTWNLTISSATPWSVAGSNFTINAGTSNIVISTTSASTRTFTGGSARYYQLSYIVSGSTGQLTITGSNRFYQISFRDASNARTLAFTSTAINVIENFDIYGTSGKLMSVQGATAASATFLMLLGAVTTGMDYLSVKDVVSVLPHKFYAGANSTLVSNTVGVLTSTPPTQPYVNQSIASGLSTATGQTATNWYYTPTPGSLLVAYIGSSSDPGTITPPSGWTLAISKAQGVSTYVYVYYKIADGTETSVTFSWVNSRSSQLVVEEIKGWTGLPTLDTTDSNGSVSATSISTGSGATNSSNPGVSIAAVTGNGSLGATPNASPPTNGFQEDYVQQVATNPGPKVIFKPLLANASQSSTITWSTNRVPAVALANFIDVPIPASDVPRYPALIFQDPGFF